MTEYGRGPGSQPWHPDDPASLPFGHVGPNGDQGWEGQQAAAGQGLPYGGQSQHYPQQSPEAHYGGQQTAYPQDNAPQSGYPQDNAPQSGYPQDNAPQSGYPQDNSVQSGYAHDGPPQPGYPQDASPQPGYPQHDFNGGWDTGQQTGYDPYADPYAGQTAAYGAERPDPYDSPEAFPPPQPPGHRHEPVEEHTDWDPGPNDREHAFFAGRDDDDDDDDNDEDHPRASRRGGRKERRGKGGKKKRSGCACLVLSLIFASGISGVGYFGYQFYQDTYGSGGDYSGNGTSEKVTVDIPKGAGGYAIGNKLEQAGVVKSAEAFVSAQGQHPKGLTIQAGVYSLNKKMSAKAAVEAMLDPKSRNNLIIAEGRRNAWVYEQIDKRLEVDKGTTEKYAKKNWKKLGLPAWASENITSDVKDPLEGFLYPASYPVAKGQKPGDVLKKMVAKASREYENYNIEGKAEEFKLDNPLQLVTVASLTQAEGKTHSDFRKMAEVVYNRLDPGNTETYQLLQFDSTFNYLMGQSEIHISEDEIKSNKDPYNTYTRKGLPPGPIGNPGHEALGAALKPTSDGWLYFVATDGMSKTEFAKTHDEFLKLKEKFNANTSG
ncbi:endolytic transglycosylase MltG [Streptomyces sp. B-S-A8]|uniref:Endolytic murein transglycosylase n=1 Tax=Streptomyces solicavernae TaxID=3043614 RepID=A0ABT6RQP1_9ACTN|nr:endolytic transglycosylase MltG [Streptomyces sp. B-S-A8]MDI3386751.1 endolytic transglycosylase MltG [Streptomyces sp. B-S-A8]